MRWPRNRLDSDHVTRRHRHSCIINKRSPHALFPLPHRSPSSSSPLPTSFGSPVFAGRCHKCMPPQYLSAHGTRRVRHLARGLFGSIPPEANFTVYRMIQDNCVCLLSPLSLTFPLLL